MGGQPPRAHETIDKDHKVDQRQRPSTSDSGGRLVIPLNNAVWKWPNFQVAKWSFSPPPLIKGLACVFSFDNDIIRRLKIQCRHITGTLLAYNWHSNFRWGMGAQPMIPVEPYRTDPGGGKELPDFA